MGSFSKFYAFVFTAIFSVLSVGFSFFTAIMSYGNKFPTKFFLIQTLKVMGFLNNHGQNLKLIHNFYIYLKFLKDLLILEK